MIKPPVLTNLYYKQSKRGASVLDVIVSCFKNYNSPDNPIQVNLLDWLNSEEENQKVDLIRSIVSIRPATC